MSYRHPGTIIYDEVRENWRVAVIVNGQRVHRRVKTHSEAIAIQRSLLALRHRDAFDRLTAGETMLDLSGLTHEQIATILVMIQSWGVADPLVEVSASDRFYEEDEPPEVVSAIFEAGEKGLTERPAEDT